jgi:hypothetical protein
VSKGGPVFATVYLMELLADVEETLVRQLAASSSWPIDWVMLPSLHSDALPMPAASGASASA